jgi:hypothetical protein
MTGRQGAALGALALAVALLVAPDAARAAMYKWVDDKGVVHYSDTMPTEAVNKGNVELNKQGVAIRKTDPALTPEQRHAKEIEDERQRQIAKQQEDVARRDNALLASYTSESEIDLARNRAVATITAALQSSQAYSEQLTKRRATLETKKGAYGGKAVPPALDREIEGIDVELARQSDFIAQKKSELNIVGVKYDTDKQRWRDLNAQRAASIAATEAAANGKPPAVANGKK